MPRLTVQIPDAEEAVYEFDDPQLTVGRNPANDIAIDHSSLSGTHAQLVLNEDGTYTLADNGSTNGTFLNGEQVVEAVLYDGAEILFGQVGAYFNHPGVEGGVAESFEPASSAAPEYVAEPLETIGRPSNFQSVSPFPKKKVVKDSVGGLVKLVGFGVFAVAIGLVALVVLKLGF